MSNFKEAIKLVLRHEGGLTKDHAGLTNFGIIGKNVKSLTIKKAKEIYKKQWWKKYNYSRIISQKMANKIFDFSVNMGAYRAHILTQESIDFIKNNNIKIDGILGKITIRELNSLNLFHKTTFLLVLKCKADSFYRGLVSKNRRKYGKFLKGWLRRVHDD